MEQGKIMEAEAPTVRVGANPTGLTAPPPKVFYRPDALPAAQPLLYIHLYSTQSQLQKYNYAIMRVVSCTKYASYLLTNGREIHTHSPMNPRSRRFGLFILDGEMRIDRPDKDGTW